MPNWVYNTLTIHGEEKKVRELMEILARPIPVQKTKQEEGDKWAKEVQGEWEMQEESKSDISFWNLISPPKNKWSEYFTVADRNAPEGNWYNWNVANWGTKWDACNRGESVETDTYADGSFNAIYYFETAWGSPDNFYAELAKYCHKRGLGMSVSWEEEQGFGQDMTLGDDGEIHLTAEWDIPESHADYVNQGKEDSCVCTWGDDDDEWFEDCPREKKK